MAQHSLDKKMRIDHTTIRSTHHPNASTSQVEVASNILQSAQSLRAQAEYFELPMVDYLLGLVVLEAEEFLGQAPRQD